MPKFLEMNSSKQAKHSRPWQIPPLMGDRKELKRRGRVRGFLLQILLLGLLSLPTLADTAEERRAMLQDLFRIPVREWEEHLRVHSHLITPGFIYTLEYRAIADTERGELTDACRYGLAAEIIRALKRGDETFLKNLRKIEPLETIDSRGIPRHLDLMYTMQIWGTALFYGPLASWYRNFEDPSNRAEIQAELSFLQASAGMPSAMWPEVAVLNKSNFSPDFFLRIQGTIDWMISNGDWQPAQKLALLADIAGAVSGRVTDFRERAVQHSPSGYEPCVPMDADPLTLSRDGEAWSRSTFRVEPYYNPFPYLK